MPEEELARNQVLLTILGGKFVFASGPCSAPGHWQGLNTSSINGMCVWSLVAYSRRLTCTTETLDQIARDPGYQDGKYFSRVFAEPRRTGAGDVSAEGEQGMGPG